MPWNIVMALVFGCCFFCLIFPKEKKALIDRNNQYLDPQWRFTPKYTAVLIQIEVAIVNKRRQLLCYFYGFNMVDFFTVMLVCKGS